jgi:hypothetical protein
MPNAHPGNDVQFSSTKEIHGQYMSEQTPRKSPKKKEKYALIPVAKVPVAAFAQQRESRSCYEKLSRSKI